ncbi:MAG: HEAT repeat domain-containing protein, partial [Alphaproteobacteria bacterium]
PLIAALADTDDAVRWQAAWSLGRLGDGGAVGPLIDVLGDRKPDVRWFATWSLAEITGEAFGDDPDAWRAWWAARPTD